MIQRQADTYLPTKFSSTELLPALWPPTTAICGRSSCICTPSCVNASCSLFTIGINCSIPVLPDILSSKSRNLRYTARITRTHAHTQHTYTQHTHTHTHTHTFFLSLYLFSTAVIPMCLQRTTWRAAALPPPAHTTSRKG